VQSMVDEVSASDAANNFRHRCHTLRRGQSRAGETAQEIFDDACSFVAAAMNSDYLAEINSEYEFVV